MPPPTDLFADKAHDYDQRPVPQQISQGVWAALERAVSLRPDQVALDFGAGTGLIATRLAARVGRVLAVDVSPSMLEQLAAKAGPGVEIRCQDILSEPLDAVVDLVVSAMAMHHVEDTDALLRAWLSHLRPGGQLAVADLDSEDGTFHPPGVEGVFHRGFDREALVRRARVAGFVHARCVDATSVDRDGRRYPIFLLLARRPG